MNNSNFDNITYIPEDNYSIINKDTLVWTGKLPYDDGCKFPTSEIIERAMISNTNNMIYQNEVEKVFARILTIIPEIDPMYGYKIRDIVANLPYFKNAVNYWVALIAGEPPRVDGDKDTDININEVIENSNFSSIMQSEVRSRFIDVVSAYRVDSDLYGKPTIVPIKVKNFIPFINKTCTGSIEVNVVFNIFKDSTGMEFVEFVEYHYNGFIKKTVYNYANGIIGKHIKELDEETKAFNGKFDISPIVVFRHNTTYDNIIGTDQFRYWIASILGAMRELQNIFRLGERTREMIKRVPESAITKDPVTGLSLFVNNGTVSYPNGQGEETPVEYIVPEIRMDEAVKAFEKAMKCVSIDTNLGPVFFDLEKLGTNLSAKSIEAALYPTKLDAKRATTEMEPYVKELVIKLCALVGIDITSASKFNINWYDGFPKDIKEETDAIQSRLGGKQSISLEDAIIKLDKIPSRIAIQKANEIKALLGNKETGNKNTTALSDNDVSISNNDIVSSNVVNTSDVGLTAVNVRNTGTANTSGDNAYWDYEIYPTPSNNAGSTVGGSRKGVVNRWLTKRLLRNHSK